MFSKSLKKAWDWLTNIGKKAELRQMGQELSKLHGYRDVEGLQRKLEHCRPAMRYLVINVIGCIGPEAKAAVPILIKLSEDFKRRYNYHDDWRNSTIVPFDRPPGMDVEHEFFTYLQARLALRKIEGLEDLYKIHE